MSTKTTIKRIALVAAVAAAFGGLSTVAANATTYDATLQATAGYSNGSAPAAGTAATATAIADGNHYVTVKLLDTGTATDNAYSVVTTGVGSLYGVATASGNGSAGRATTNFYNNGTSVSAGFVWSADTTFPTTSTFTQANTDYVTFAALSSAAGTQTITATPTNGTSGAVTLTITWGAAPAISTQYSTSQISSYASNTLAVTSNEYTGSDAAVVASATASATPAAIIGVTLSSAYQTPFSAPLTATITGAGSVSITEDGTSQSTGSSTSGTGSTGTAVTSSTSNEYYRVLVYPNGTAGVGTITLTSGTTAIATKTITFSGSAKAVAVVQNLKVLKAGGTYTSLDTDLAADLGKYYNGDLSSYYSGVILSDGGGTTYSTTTSLDIPTPVMTVTTTDSSGNQSPITVSYGTNIKIVVSDSSVLTAQTCTNVATYKDAAGVSHANEINCVVTGTTGAASGATATATVELYDSTTSAWDILATPVTFTIGGAVASETPSLDAAIYTPGQPLVLTVTAKDSKGNAAYDQDGSFFGSAKSSVYTPSLPKPVAIVGGVGTGKGYAPTVEGDFTLTGTDDSALGNAISVTATVTGGGSTTAANAATDAANQATDAANNAIDAANAAADTAQTAADAAQSAADTATQALAAAQDADQNASDALDAAQEATDAGNAATDAANAAADSADAATAAAQDASDKAAAALAAVTQLSAQFTTLAAQVAKVLSVVQAIAKKK